MYKIVIIVLNIMSFTHSSKITWLPNTSFNLASNFKNGKLPCSKQTVIFPESIITSVQIESGTSVSGFVLPLDGELILQGVIELGPSKDNNCTDDGNVFYLEKSIRSWSQPDVWSSPRFNDATPDAERVPCFEDIVEFPSNSVFTINLPERTQTVRGIRVGGRSLTTQGFNDMIISPFNSDQQFILNSKQSTGIRISAENCQSFAGCQCQKNILEIDCSNKFCPKPACVDPIQPTGHCCQICGGFIVITIDQSFDVISLEELARATIDSYGDKNLEYHIGRLQNDKVQLIVVEKGEYLGTSAEVVNAIYNRMEKHTLQESQISGGPVYKSGLAAKLFIGMFFVVVSIFGAIYLYYYKLTEVNFPIITHGPGTFSRFNRRTESVVSLTRRDSGVGVSSHRAFRNPLYDSKRQKVTVEESVDED